MARVPLLPSKSLTAARQALISRWLACRSLIGHSEFVARRQRNPSASCREDVRMKKVIAVCALVFGLVMPAWSQQAPLRLVQTLPVPGVEGRFDHFAVDLSGKRLFLAAPDHKTVEVFDLTAGKWIHSISGFITPHAIVYLPESNRIMLSDGGDDTPNGWCRILRGDTFEL